MIEASHVVIAQGGRRVCGIASLRVREGERLGIAGRSGAGKSSLLQLCAGLSKPAAGAWTNTFARPAIMFQQPTLLPWRTVRDNLIIPLRAGGFEETQAQARADDWLRRVGLDKHAHAWPSSLSGGMAQRLALARALAYEPDLLLLDEPFSALDPALRARMMRYCEEWLDVSGAAMICVSHQPEELAGLTTRCLVFMERVGVVLHDDPFDPLSAQIHRALTGPS